MSEEPRIIEFVFRVETNGDDSFADDIIQHGSEELFPDYRDENPEDFPYTEYIPEGSHWEEVDEQDEYVQLYRRRKEERGR